VTVAARKAPTEERIRAFVALDLEPMSHRRVARLSDRLRMGSGAPSATWTPTANLHVTLKFAAELPVSAVTPLSEALAPLVEGKPPPPACSLRLDAFPSVKEAKIVVVELVDATGALAKLAAKVEKLTSKYGVAKEERAFRPHVTIARLKLDYDARRWLRPALAEIAGECRASGLTLYRSDLSGEEPRYTPLARFAFEISPS